jgi:uncharacterized protein DUF4386
LTDPISERLTLRLSSASIVAGLVVSQVATLFHPSGPDLNDNPAIFEEYAESGAWVAVHLVQFAGGLLILGGLILLLRLWQTEGGTGSTLAALGVAAAAATAAVLAVLQAVDGVALKRAVDDWVSASPADKASAFQVAEGVRWVEYGVSALFSALLGLTTAVGGVIMLRTDLFPRWLGWLGAIAGVGLGALGVLIAYEGFSDAQQTIGFAVSTVFSVWLLVTAFLGWRRSPH